jgi:hypothetical protein
MALPGSRGSFGIAAVSGPSKRLEPTREMSRVGLTDQIWRWD